MRTIPLVLLCLLFTAASSAGDWPQILGPNRNGIADEETLKFDWPTSGPKVIWGAPVGSGFAGPAVADGRTVVFHRQGKNEIADCYQATSGKKLWSKSFPSGYVPSVSYDDGPRCVPTIVDGKVILYGAQGSLRCLDAQSGNLVWTVETHQKYGADEGYFGAGSSPLVLDGRVIVNVGGARRNAGIVAFSAKDGKELWKATSEAASYSSPILASVNEKPMVIAITRMSCVGLDPARGEVKFQIPFGKRGPTVNAANPLVSGDKLFLSASYGIGAIFGTVSDEGLKTIWQSDELLSSQYTTSVWSEGKLFGVHGRQDIGLPSLRCLDPAQRQILWEQQLDHYANLILADDHLLISTIGGELIVAKANPEKYEEIARANIQGATDRGASLPALANGRFYSRDANTLRCFSLGE